MGARERRIYEIKLGTAFYNVWADVRVLKIGFTLWLINIWIGVIPEMFKKLFTFMYYWVGEKQLNFLQFVVGNKSMWTW